MATDMRMLKQLIRSSGAGQKAQSLVKQGESGFPGLTVQRGNIQQGAFKDMGGKFRTAFPGADLTKVNRAAIRRRLENRRRNVPAQGNGWGVGNSRNWS